MATILPLQPGDARYQFSTDLLGETYVFRVRWNERAKAGYIDVLERDETPIVLGAKIVLGAAIAHHVPHRLFMGGVLIARDQSRQGREATLDDLGDRVQLVYMTRDDMIAEMLGGDDREAP